MRRLVLGTMLGAIVVYRETALPPIAVGLLGLLALLDLATHPRLRALMHLKPSATEPGAGMALGCALGAVVLPAGYLGTGADMALSYPGLVLLGAVFVVDLLAHPFWWTKACCRRLVRAEPDRENVELPREQSRLRTRQKRKGVKGMLDALKAPGTPRGKTAPGKKPETQDERKTKGRAGSQQIEQRKVYDMLDAVMMEGVEDVKWIKQIPQARRWGNNWVWHKLGAKLNKNGTPLGVGSPGWDKAQEEADELTRRCARILFDFEWDEKEVSKGGLGVEAVQEMEQKIKAYGPWDENGAATLTKELDAILKKVRDKKRGEAASSSSAEPQGEVAKRRRSSAANDMHPSKLHVHSKAGERLNNLEVGDTTGSEMLNVSVSSLKTKIVGFELGIQKAKGELPPPPPPRPAPHSTLRACASAAPFVLTLAAPVTVTRARVEAGRLAVARGAGEGGHGRAGQREARRRPGQGAGRLRATLPQGASRSGRPSRGDEPQGARRLRGAREALRRR